MILFSTIHIHGIKSSHKIPSMMSDEKQRLGNKLLQTKHICFNMIVVIYYKFYGV